MDIPPDIRERHKELLDHYPCVVFDIAKNGHCGYVYKGHGATYQIGFGYTKDENPILDRGDGPALYVHSVETHNLVMEQYWIHGVQHRPDGPAAIWYMPDGLVESIEYIVDGKRHRADGPAVTTRRNNSEQWYLKGVHVNEQIALRPETLTRKDILAISNVEIRRVAMEMYGWEKFLADITEEDIFDKRIDPVTGIEEKLVFLFRNQIRNRRREEEIIPVNALICFCPSTARLYAVEVPAIIRTCEAAQEWLKGPGLKNMQIIGAS